MISWKAAAAVVVTATTVKNRSWPESKQFFLAWRRFYHSKSHKYEKKRKCFSNRCKAFRRIRFYFSTKHKILSFLFLHLKFWTNAFHATKMFNCGVFLKRLTFENEIVRKIGLILAFMSAKMLRFSRTDQTNTQFHRSPRPKQLFAGIFLWTIYKQKNKFMRMWNRLYNFFSLWTTHTHSHNLRSLHGTMRPAQSEWSERTVPVPCMFDYVYIGWMRIWNKR